MMEPADDAPSAGGTVTKQQLAAACQVSVATLDAWLRKWPDFPVVERGGKGVGWKFDLAAALAFVAQHRDASAAPAGVSTGRTSVAVQLQEARLARMTMENRKAAGELMEAGEVAAVLGDVFAEMSRRHRDFIRQIGRQHGWPDAITRTTEAEFAALQRSIVADLDDRLSGNVANDAAAAV